MQCYTHLCTCNILAKGDEELLVFHIPLILSIHQHLTIYVASYLIHLMNKGIAIANWYLCW